MSWIVNPIQLGNELNKPCLSFHYPCTCKAQSCHCGVNLCSTETPCNFGCVVYTCGQNG